MKTLYINACVRDDSRTDRLARKLLGRLGDYAEVSLKEEDLQPLNTDSLERRVKLLEAGNYDDPWFRYAKQFAEAETIVIGAPFWDLSFPSILKVYIENIYVMGLVSEYGPDGMSKGLCKAKKAYYVTTAGGYFEPKFSYDYIRELFGTHFGIEETVLIKAEMLDVVGYDVETILEETSRKIEDMQL